MGEHIFSDCETFEVCAHWDGTQWDSVYADWDSLPGLPAKWQWREGANPLYKHLVWPSPGRAVRWVIRFLDPQKTGLLWINNS